MKVWEESKTAVEVGKKTLGAGNLAGEESKIVEVQELCKQLLRLVVCNYFEVLVVNIPLDVAFLVFWI